jgi:hypothetical protein
MCVCVCVCVCLCVNVCACVFACMCVYAYMFKVLHVKISAMVSPLTTTGSGPAAGKGVW